MKKIETFEIYKGLQRPLVFKMLKGKFIYYGAVALVGGVVFGGIISALVSNTLGFVAMILTTGPAFFWVLKKQKAGLYNKTRNAGQLFIIEPKHFLRRKYIHHDQEEI